MLYVSPGNLKMDVPTFSLPAKVTCPGSTEECREHCYAIKAERQYPPVLPSRNRNLDETVTNTFTNDMVNLLGRRRKSLIRIHESGDMYDQIYLDKWIEICMSLSDKVFFCATKSWHLDWSRVPENMKVYWSLWPDTNDIPLNGLYACAGESIPDGIEVRECPSKCNPCGYKCWLEPSHVRFAVH